MLLLCSRFCYTTKMTKIIEKGQQHTTNTEQYTKIYLSRRGNLIQMKILPLKLIPEGKWDMYIVWMLQMWWEMGDDSLSMQLILRDRILIPHSRNFNVIKTLILSLSPNKCEWESRADDYFSHQSDVLRYFCYFTNRELKFEQRTVKMRFSFNLLMDL